MNFELHQALSKESFFLVDLRLSKLLLKNDCRYPWLILVPRIINCCEIFELNEDEQSLLLTEISMLSKKIKSYFHADKINVATLGNKVSQLHVHIIARKKTDLTWPNTVWDKGEPIPYTKVESDTIINDLKNCLLQ